MRILRIFICFLSALLIISCSTNLSDGGTDFPNTKTVSGIIKNVEGDFTDSIYVLVLPRGYRIDINAPIVNELIRTALTDSNGLYELQLVDNNSYNILAIDLRKRDRLFYSNLSVNGTNVEVDTLSLTKTGSLIVPTKGKSLGYHSLIISGTNYEPEIYDDYAIFDSLPEAVFPEVLLFGEIIADSIEIKSNETKTIATALFVVKFENSSIDSFDTHILSEMKKCGMQFKIVEQNNFTIEDTTGINVIVLSTSIDQDTLKYVFGEMNKPVVNFEYYMQPYLYMTDTSYNIDYGSENDYTEIKISDYTHEITNELNGITTLFNAPSHLDWGRPAGDAKVLAVCPDDSTKSVIYCFDKGDSMNSIVAPQKRAAFLFWRQNSFLINDTGLNIMRNMLIWSVK